MKKYLIFLFVTAGFVASSYANTWVKCGKSLNKSGDDVIGYELELSSEGEDIYKGPVGVSWNLKLGSEDAEWITKRPNITARTVQKNIEITIAKGQSMSGPAGTKYVLIGLYKDYPVLEKYILGGFAGGTKTGTFKCISGND